MSSTIVFHVKGTACASSKKRLGRSEAVEAAAAGALAKEDMVVPIGGIPTAEKELLIAAKFECDRFVDTALSESIEAAGETPSDRYDRLRRC